MLTDKSQVKCRFSKQQISLEAIKQIISIYHDKYQFVYDDVDNDYEIIISGNEQVKEFAEEFKREVLDQEIRISLQKDFGELRNLIVRFAFFPAEAREKE